MITFTCLLRHGSFFREDFQFTENRGVAVDDSGRRYLNAWIKLTTPCPFCGERHEYHASELACTFSSNAGA